MNATEVNLEKTDNSFFKFMAVIAVFTIIGLTYSAYIHTGSVEQIAARQAAEHQKHIDSMAAMEARVKNQDKRRECAEKATKEYTTLVPHRPDTQSYGAYQNQVVAFVDKVCSL